MLIRTDRIGDVILSIPVAKIIKSTWPDSEVHFLVRTYTLPIVEDQPEVDFSWTAESYPNLRQKISYLRNYRFDAVIQLHPEADWALAAYLARVPLRIGTGFRAFSLFFNRKVWHHRKRSGRHEADLNLDLLEPLGIENAEVKLSFAIPEQADKFIKTMLAQEGVQGDYIVLHPGSGGSAMDWPVERFGELADHIFERLHLPVVFTGSVSEKALVKRAIDNCRFNHIRLDGRLDLNQLAALVKGARVVVANSTGPLHLSVAVGTEVVGLYCPEQACHPKRWGPYGRKDSVVLPPVDTCKKCVGKKCEYFPCMELIPVESVLEKVTEKVK